MIQKQGDWVPYELKPRDVERRFLMCELLLQRQKRKGFLHRIITGDGKWIHYDNPKRKKSWGMLGHASTSSPKPNIHGSKLLLCIWWDQQGVIYYKLLKPNETITGARYRLQLMRLSRALKEKRPLYEQRHDKVILSCGKNSQNLPGNASMGSSTPPAVFTGHSPLQLPLVSVDSA